MRRPRPSETDTIVIKPYDGPAGGWGSARSVSAYVIEHGVSRVGPPLRVQNKPGGHACVSCSWAKPANPHPFEFCENGAKATAWELTDKTISADFFARHTVSELLSWPDHDLEIQGRLTEPMRFDRASDRWVKAGWDEAFSAIGSRLRACEPRKSVFYVSGRASLETSFLFQLFARRFGSNHLPDSSNMCHETTSVALPQSIGVPVGTARLPDFETTDLILYFGHNVGVNAPRLLHPLQEASKRGVPIIVVNPLRERGLERFTNPQNPVEMALGQETRIASHYLQVTGGGDLAVITGMAKAVLALDDAAKANGGKRILDEAFIAEHCHGWDEFEAFLRGADWDEIVAESGLGRPQLEEAGALYAKAPAALALYGMGLTQQLNGVETVQMLVNLLLMRGNIGRPGAGICPVRGHSNVQGQRTVGITEKPELAPLDAFRERYRFEPPRWEGWSTVDVCQNVLEGEVQAFIGLGGNFLRAVPETDLMEEAWARIPLTVHIATKLNRTHLVPGEEAWLLPCLGRIEIDRQKTGEQAVTVEDSTAVFHASRGQAEPAAPDLRSEPAIVAGLAKATLVPEPALDWDGWVADYSRIRNEIEACWPDIFKDFNQRMWTPGGFPRPLPAAERQWETETGKANFLIPSCALNSHGLTLREGLFRLLTIRSNDQFNTTVYGYDDRFRGVSGTRMVVFMNGYDIARAGLVDRQRVTLVSAAEDGRSREVKGLMIVSYDIPEGCIAAYYPECNPLIALDHHGKEGKVPAAKSVPVTIRGEAQ